MRPSATRATCAHLSCDPCSGGLHRFMLPDDHDRPPCFREASLRLPVACLIALDLPSPVLRVGGWRSVVVRASVPEAPAHLNRDPGRAEHDVGAVAHLTDRTCAHPVPQPHCVELPPQQQLRLRVSAPIALHGAARRSAGGPRLFAHTLTVRRMGVVVSSAMRKPPNLPEDHPRHGTTNGCGSWDTDANRRNHNTCMSQK